LIFFHHEPSYTDNQLEKIEKSYAGNDMQCVMAKEGMEITL
jgi:hypothetical protein